MFQSIYGMISQEITLMLRINTIWIKRLCDDIILICDAALKDSFNLAGN